jgi:hypothetical protein
MKQVLIFFLMCVTAYANTACLVGGSSASNTNAGFYDPDEATKANSFNANGAAIITATGVTYDHTGGTVERMFSQAGIGTGVEVGMYAYTSGTNITTGRYKVTTVAGDDSYIACSAIVATGDNADSVVNVGGAVPIVDATFDLQDVLDDTTIGSAASQNVDIYITGTGTTAATIDLDAGGGSTTTSKILWASDTSYDYSPGSCTINTTTTLANGLFQFSVEDYYGFYGIIFDAGGKDSSRAAYCVNAAGTGDGVGSVFGACQFTGASSDGYHMNTNDTYLVGCEANANGGAGISTITSSTKIQVVACDVHDNDQHGIAHRSARAVFIGNTIHNNGLDAGTYHGLHELASVSNATFIGNTLYLNDNGNGFNRSSGSAGGVFYNNTCVDNDGYGYNFNGTVPAYFGYNHASLNTTDATDATTDFTNYGAGNNIDGVQAVGAIFVDAGNDDFTPVTGSDLIDAGLDATLAGEQDIGAIQQAAGAGTSTFPRYIERHGD